VNVNRRARIAFFCGAPGSGKSHEAKVRLSAERAERLIVIDPDGEYEGFGALHESLSALLPGLGWPSFHVRFKPSFVRATAERQFDLLCQLVRWLVDPQPGQARPALVAPVTFAVDELADFVGPSFRDAPESWQWIIRRGRKYGVTLYALSQRPAQIDKTLFSLASELRSGRLNDANDQRTVAAALGVAPDVIAGLQGYEAIQRDKLTGALVLPARTAKPHKPARRG